MKLCENCKKNPFTVKLTEVVGGKKKELYLCDSCAREKGIQLVFSKVGEEKEEKDKVAALPSERVCPKCGMTFSLFKATGLLGCPEDYTVFEDSLREILEQIHGSVEHKGKIPVHADSDLAKERQIFRLKKQLQRAVEREEYEKAAKLRDKILELEGKKNGPSSLSE